MYTEGERGRKVGKGGEREREEKKEGHRLALGWELSCECCTHYH